MNKPAKIINRLCKFKDLSLKVKSILIFSIVVILPSATLGTLILVETNKVLKEQALDYTERKLETIDDNLTATIQDVEDISTYMIFSDEFRRYMTYSLETIGNDGKQELEEDLKGFFVFHLMSKNYINSITLEGINGDSLYMGEPIDANEKEWEKIAEKAAGKIQWTNSYSIDSHWSGEVDVISMFRVINDLNDINRKIGLVKIRLNEQALYKYIDSGFTKKQGSTFILSDDGTVILHGNDEYLGKQYPDPVLEKKINTDIKNSSFSYSIKGKDYLVATRQINRTGWNLVAMIDEDEILKELRGISSKIIIFLVLSTVLGFLALVGFYLTIIRPLLNLTNKTRQVEHGDFSVSINVKSKDEIGKLESRFNSMVGTIRHLINTKYKLEIKQRESELKVLQNQIDPHFLYNTLDMIRWTARMENALETSRLIELLSRMFRISLSKGKLWIPLKQEISYVESYLELQKKRMGNQISYSSSVDEQVTEVLVLKQVLQPLVENSIVHGFRRKNEGCHIEISSFKEESNLIIDIKDNGSGVDVSTMNTYLKNGSTKENSGFALLNVNDRISTAFGPDYGLTFIDQQHKGAWVRLKFPILSDETEVKSLTESLGDRDEYQNTDR
ncbi:sensor histidine kinase [Metabacillus dongyingensis]|uniref:sensor histidine kinase n=1 Tax=Metabacillus dongyingensis TaxID=2874282 RepID=UPI003B8D9AB6